MCIYIYIYAYVYVCMYVCVYIYIYIILAPPLNYLSTKGLWATQPLEQILDSEFLLCELRVFILDTTYRASSKALGGKRRQAHFESLALSLSIYIYIYIFTHICTLCIHVCLHTSLSLYIYIYTRNINMYLSLYIYIYIYTHTYTLYSFCRGRACLPPMRLKLAHCRVVHVRGYSAEGGAVDRGCSGLG